MTAPTPTGTGISRRHRILIAAAAAAVVGSPIRIREITPVGWSQLRPGYRPVHAVPAVRHGVPVHIRTARREKAREAANLA
jgi:hypothetical protein